MLKIAMYLRIFLFLIVCFQLNIAIAQSDTDQFNTIEKLIENSDLAGDYNELEDQMSRFRIKRNLNQCSALDFLALKFLSPNQVAAILNHKYEFGDFVSILELQTIDVISLDEIRHLSQWFSIEDKIPDPKKIWKQITGSERQFVVTSSTNMPRSLAYHIADSNDKVTYSGSPISCRIRFRSNYNQKFIYGFNAEKDEGESVLKSSDKKGFDFYSAHVFLNGKALVKKIAIGDFQVGFGQGLTLGSGMGFGKSAMVLNVKRVNQGLRPYRAFDENDFLRGMGITLGNRKFENSFIFSRKRIDANLDLNESNGELGNMVRSLVNDGLHRTDLEKSKKDVLNETILAHNLNYSNKHLHLGLTSFFGKYDINFMQSNELYKRYEFSEKQFLKTGFYMDYYFKNVNFFSELCLSKLSKPGYVAGVFVSLAKSIDFVLVNRYYPKSFLIFKTNSFSESSKPINEHGTYLGLTYKPNRKVSVSSYFDRFVSPWYSFYVDGISRGNDFLTEFHFQPSKSSLIYFRYRQKLETKNSASELYNSLLWTQKRSFRIHIEFMATSFLKIKSRLEFANFNNTHKHLSAGNLLFVDLIYKKNLSPFSLTLRMAWFNTDNYDTRIYAVENDVMYSWSVPAFNGVGSKFYSVIKYKIKKNISLQMRYSNTQYLDREVIGSGNNSILSNKLHEINFLISCGF